MFQLKINIFFHFYVYLRFPVQRCKTQINYWNYTNWNTGNKYFLFDHALNHYNDRTFPTSQSRNIEITQPKRSFCCYSSSSLGDLAISRHQVTPTSSLDAQYPFYDMENVHLFSLKLYCCPFCVDVSCNCFCTRTFYYEYYRCLWVSSFLKPSLRV